jgi:hypothetical protein
MVWAQQAQIEQARQFQARSAAGEATAGMQAGPASLDAGSSGDTESFGIQQFLREQERLRLFRAFADVSAFVTNNVALARVDPQADSFLVAVFGLEYRRPLPRGFQFDASLRAATFRYNEFRQLDFNSVDAGAGLSYHTEKLGGLDFFARYNFNQLISAESEDTFFKNHTITLGVQKPFVFSQAHYAYLGVAGQLGFADPKEAERSEWSAYAGYHLQATRRMETDLLYRYAYYHYSEGERRDHNQTLSLSLRYRFFDWFSASASSFATWNRSELPVFDYDAANAGGGLTLSLQF